MQYKMCYLVMWKSRYFKLTLNVAKGVILGDHFSIIHLKKKNIFICSLNASKSLNGYQSHTKKTISLFLDSLSLNSYTNCIYMETFSKDMFSWSALPCISSVLVNWFSRKFAVISMNSYVPLDGVVKIPVDAL